MCPEIPIGAHHIRVTAACVQPRASDGGKEEANVIDLAASGGVTFSRM